MTTIRSSEQQAVLAALSFAYEQANGPVGASQVRQAGLHLGLKPKSRGRWDVFTFDDRTKRVLDQLVAQGVITAHRTPKTYRTYEGFATKTYGPSAVNRSPYFIRPDYSRKGQTPTGTRTQIITKYEP